MKTLMKQTVQLAIVAVVYPVLALVYGTKEARKRRADAIDAICQVS